VSAALDALSIKLHCSVGRLQASLKSVHQRLAAHVYEIWPRADKHRVDLISDALPYRPMWCRGPNAGRDAIDSAKFHSRSHHAVIRIFDEAGNVIETHEHAGDFKEW
jgi:hypothetical protein